MICRPLRNGYLGSHFIEGREWTEFKQCVQDYVHTDARSGHAKGFLDASMQSAILEKKIEEQEVEAQRNDDAIEKGAKALFDLDKERQETVTRAELFAPGCDFPI